MRIVFMGTPDFAVPVLGELIGQGHEIACVYTRPPMAGGRGMAERSSPIHALAQRFGLPIRHPRSLRDADVQAEFRSLDADVGVVVAYGMILPPDILEAPRLGCLNLHASLLPRWRGAAPIQRAIMAGDGETGVAVMGMEAGLDTGPVAMEERVAIAPGMTAGDLHDRLAPIGADLMGRAVAALGRGTLQFTPQPAEGVTYADKISKAECRIDWSRSAREVASQILGLSPFPGAFFEIDLGHGSERIKVLRALADRGSGEPGTVLDDDLTVACGEGAVRLTEVQRAGKGPLSAQAFLRGARIARGTTLAGI